MKNRNRSMSPAGLCLLVVLFMAVMLFMSACRGGETPAGEQNSTHETTGNVTDSGTAPSEQVTDPADGETDKDTAAEDGTDPADDPADTNPEEPTDTAEPTPPDSPEETEGATQPPVTEEPEVQGPVPNVMLFEDYQALSGAQQLAFFQSFPTPEEFFVWYNAALEDYNARNPGAEIGPGGMIPVP